MKTTTQRTGNPFELEGAVIEVCERRLVLAAQLLVDMLGGLTVNQHVQSVVQHGNLEPHLQDAHAATGWNQVQQEFGITGARQTVAVIDSGIAWDHEALGEGYGPGYRVVGGWDFTEENDAQPYDDGPAGFHGTHVAGIIGSSDNNHPGVARDVDLVALRVFNDLGQGQLAWVEQALEWVHTNRNSFENPITTVNLSLGTTWNADSIPNWATLEDELQQLANEGITVVASAGNSFRDYNAPGLSYPAASPYVLPVASVGDDGELSDFSQRNQRVIAAPGENIVSTVPDYVFGRDGRVNDFSGASGTSMAAPYVAGTSVLVRQAMEMVGYDSINVGTIAEHLHHTADSVFDSATGLTYNRLNLAAAIDAIIPDDSVSDLVSNAQSISLVDGSLSGWINSLGDQDVYQFTASASGSLSIDAASDWASSLNWTLQTAGQEIASGTLGRQVAEIVAGQTYQLIVGSDANIGGFDLGFSFTSSSNGEGSSGGGASAPQVLGQVDYLEQEVAGGSHLRVQAVRDGVFTALWAGNQSEGKLDISVGGGSLSDSVWQAGALRVDVDVSAGQWIDIVVPGSASQAGELTLANVLEQNADSVHVYGTLSADDMSLDLQQGLEITVGRIDYEFQAGQIAHLTIDGFGNNDSLTVIGSQAADKVDLTPTGSTISNNDIDVEIASVEQIAFSSGGGPDRVYLYDSNTDDTLTAHPNRAELIGVGYRFSVEEVSRIFIHATGGGQDFAYLYDGEGDDRLSVRPQFTSMTGEGFFNYVRGFERVYAYANAGGQDTANIYDSAANDRFTTNGASASINGPGFSSFTRSFEQVNAFADAGGDDLATLYGSSNQTAWQQGSDFVNFREEHWTREARGFETVEAFVGGQPHSMGSLTIDTFSMDAATATRQASGEHPYSQTQPSATVDTAESQQVESRNQFEPEGEREPDDRAAIPIAANASTAWNELHAQVLQNHGSHREWLAARSVLPGEELLSSPELEYKLLDELFSLHDDLL